MSIASELEALRNKDGLILAEDVVDWAKSHPRSELHKAPEFCGWDESKAAREHWLRGARRLIATVEYQEGERKFYSLSTDRARPGGGYRDIGDIRMDKNLYDILLADALAELNRVEAKYNHLKELEPVWVAIRGARGRGAGKGRGATAAA